VIVSTRAPIGHIAIAGDDMCFNQGCKAIIVKDPNKVLNDFVYYALLTKVEEMNALGSGATFKEISRKKMASILIPLPPLEEQKRIVSRLDQLISRAEEAKRLRKLAREEAERIMQAALNKVFRRAEEEGWESVKLNDVAEVKYGKAKPKEFGDIPVVGSGGIYGYTNKALVNFPTIVIGRKGTAGEVWMMDTPCWPSDTTFYLEWRSSSKLVEPHFIFWHFKFAKPSGEKGKTTLPSLLRQDLENYPIFLPPLEEQKKVISYLNEIKGVTKLIIGLQQKTEDELEKLVPSILDKAFKRELIKVGENIGY
jgi:type I restriction enzyme S subunit